MAEWIKHCPSCGSNNFDRTTIKESGWRHFDDQPKKRISRTLKLKFDFRCRDCGFSFEEIGPKKNMSD